jgi:hypothetical protein
MTTDHVKNALQNAFNIVQYGKAYINIDSFNTVGQNIISTYLFDLGVEQTSNFFVLSSYQSYAFRSNVHSLIYSC